MDSTSKIIRFIWSNDSLLQSELDKSISTKQVTDVEAADYGELISKSLVWWSLLSMFKMDSFKSGLHFKIPRAFGDSAEIEDLTNPPAEPSTTGSITTTAVVEPSVRPISSGTTQSRLPKRASACATKVQSLTARSHVDKDSSSEDEENLPTVKPRAKRPRTRENTSSKSEFRNELEDLASFESQSMPSNERPDPYRSLDEKLCTLQQAAKTLNEGEAKAVLEVVESLLKLHGTGNLAGFALRMQAALEVGCLEDLPM